LLVLPTDCVFCHQADYVSAPSHVTSNFPQTCESCHSITIWEDATFDHSFFPLSGGHSGAQCISCHTTGTYGTIPSDCASCHDTDYQQAPGHVSSGFPMECTQCHTVTTWLNATFDHGIFPLSGGHNGVQCISCHTTGTYGPIPSDCGTCHGTDYQQAPGHASSGFPTDCLFCHQADYASAPSHVASNFPQTCENCHSITLWNNATYDHSFFPLSGGHNGIQCVSCHTTGTYGTIPADCFSCHQSEYQQAPGHTGSFPTTCGTCHTVTTWQNATFDHSFFSLSGGHNGLACMACHTVSSWANVNFFHSFPLSGPHAGRDCVECHDAGTTQEFSCYGTCHEHTQSRMNDKHSQEPGYAYDFQLCLSCHPDGRH
jgi:hypothetical protein